MKILQINQQIGPGGAAGICQALHLFFTGKGHESFVLTGRQLSNLNGVRVLAHDRYRSIWGRIWMSTAHRLNYFRGRIYGVGRITERWLPRLASPERFLSWWNGHEDFNFPGTRHLLEQVPFNPHILHLHNLHGDFFDLRELGWLSKEIPTVITLHDAWLLSGHCSHSFECERWKTGCGPCPHLDTPPIIYRDGSAFNWKRKREIYKACQLSLVCPSHWLADKVKQSLLMPGVRRLKIIPNGVDTTEFKPRDRAIAREKLGWPQEAFIIIFAANGVRKSVWKDYSTMRKAIHITGRKDIGRAIRFYAIGDTAPSEQIGQTRIDFLPYRDSMTDCYNAADIYIHAAKADTFPTTIIEALACGVPVVATAVGGITEQVIDGETGFMVPSSDPSAMAECIVQLAQSPEMARAMGIAAAKDASSRFSLERMIAKYESLYLEMIEEGKAKSKN